MKTFTLDARALKASMVTFGKETTKKQEAARGI